MNRAELIEYCLTFPDGVVDQPFEDDDSWVARHRLNRKWFALIMEREDCTWVNLKCDPIRSQFFRDVFPSVTPGWHMNKRHWITVRLDGTVPDGVIMDMVIESHALTSERSPRSQRP